MATPRHIQKIPITWTDDQSQAIFCGDFRNMGLTIVGTGTVSVLASKDLVSPDFTVASTIDNSYATVVLCDETVANTYATSLTVAGATKLAEINSNLYTWISVTRTVDTVDVFVTVTTNL